VKRTVIANLIAMLSALGPKLWALLGAVVKSAKVTKLGLAGASVLAYAYLTTWEFAIVMIVGLFIHEYGHVWAMRKFGLKVRGMYFIPFVGAVAVPDEMFKRGWQEAVIALMGPTFGLTVTGLSYAAYLATHQPFIAAVTSWLAMVNLFNLLPVTPLDGGRVATSLVLSIPNRMMGLCLLAVTGLGALAYMIYSHNSALVPLLLMMGAFEIISCLRETRPRIERLPGLPEGRLGADVQGSVEEQVQDLLAASVAQEDRRLVSLRRDGDDWLVTSVPRMMSLPRGVVVALWYFGLVAVLYGLMQAVGGSEADLARDLMFRD
jgi:Zn-dependent protease